MDSVPDLDVILVGDSLANVVYGHASTTAVTLDDVVRHTRAVAKGSSRACLVADMPALTYCTPAQAVVSAHKLVHDGLAQAVKLEGGEVAQLAAISAIVEAGVPVVGHLGLTPQTATSFALHAKSAADALELVQQALAVQAAGACALVLEKIPAQVATLVTSLLTIPTIGIGAGGGCDGQVLVIADVLGTFPTFKPKFVKQYANLHAATQAAVAAYCRDVITRAFPGGGGATVDEGAAPTLPSAPTNRGSKRPTPPHQYHYDMAPAEAVAFLALVRDAVAAGKLPANPAAVDALARAVAGLQPGHGVDAGARVAGIAAPRHRVAIVGTGAIATVLARHLIESGGAEVTMFTMTGARAHALTSTGIRVATGTADAPPCTVPVQVHNLAAWDEFRWWRYMLRKADATADMPDGDVDVDWPTRLSSQPPFDAVFVATKATAAVSAAAAATLLAAGGSAPIIPLFNGGFTLEYFAALLAQLAAGEGGDGVASMLNRRASHLGLPLEWARHGDARELVHAPPAHIQTVLQARLGPLHPHQLVYGTTYQGAKVERGMVVHTGVNPTCIAPVQGSHLSWFGRPTPPLLAAAAPSDAIARQHVARVHELLNSSGWVAHAVPGEHLPALRASKIAVNSVLNALAAVTGVANGIVPDIMRTYPAAADALAHQAAAACVQVAQASVYATLPHPATMAHVSGAGVLESVARVAASTAGNTSTMLADGLSGRRGEWSLLNGWVEAVASHPGLVWRGPPSAGTGEQGAHGTVAALLQARHAFLTTGRGDGRGGAVGFGTNVEVDTVLGAVGPPPRTAPAGGGEHGPTALADANGDGVLAWRGYGVL